MAPHRVEADVILFDLDGTLVNTTEAVERIWRDLCSEHNVNADKLFEYSHGTRTSEVLARFFPKIDNTGNKYALTFEAMIAKENGHLVKGIPGNITLLNALHKDRWCIVTSGNQGLASGWFNNILKDTTKPEVFITADLVSKGKPDPEGYLKGAELLSQKLGLDYTAIHKIVFEDAPVGIKAGVNAGALVIGVASSFDPQLLYESGATYVIKDLTHVNVIDGEKVTLEVDAIEKK